MSRITMPLASKVGHFLHSGEDRMSVKNYDQVKTLIDIGMEKRYLTPDKINDFLPQNICSPEDIEDIFDFLSESNIDVVDTMKEKIEAPGEEQREWEEAAERFPAEKTDNIIWAYLKDIGRVSLLTSEEEYDIGKRIEVGENEVRGLLLELPQAIAELQELSTQIKKGGVNIIDVLKNIDEMNYTKKDEEEYKKKTVKNMLCHYQQFISISIIWMDLECLHSTQYDFSNNKTIIKRVG